jgi:hypothetical protein
MPILNSQTLYPIELRARELSIIAGVSGEDQPIQNMRGHFRRSNPASLGQSPNRQAPSGIRLSAVGWSGSHSADTASDSQEWNAVRARFADVVERSLLRCRPKEGVSDARPNSLTSFMASTRSVGDTRRPTLYRSVVESQDPLLSQRRAPTRLPPFWNRALSLLPMGHHPTRGWPSTTRWGGRRRLQWQSQTFW